MRGTNQFFRAIGVVILAISDIALANADKNNTKSKFMMKKLIIYICICSSALLYTSCVATKWENQEDLIGEWYSVAKDGAKIVFNADSTCEVINLPTKVPYFETMLSPVEWNGAYLFKTTHYDSLESWNFSGYYEVKERVLYNPNGSPYYRYYIIMSPHREMVGSDQERRTFMHNSNAEDLYWIKVQAWTETFFTRKARVHYLYSYVGDPDGLGYNFSRRKKFNVKKQ